MTDDNMESATRAERLLKVCREQCRVRRCKGAGTSCARVLLILVNLTFLVTGVILVVLGVWVHIYRDTLFFTYLLRFNNTSSSSAAAAAAAAQQQQHSISSSLSSIHSSSGSSSPSATVASLQSSVGDIVSIDNCPFILIAAGCCITTVGFLGCCGAYAESVCFLGFFSILTVLFVAIEITIIAVSPRAKRDLSIRLLESLQHQVHYNYNSTAQRVNDTQSDTYKLTLAWNTLQAYLNCCGAVGPQDYALSAWFNHTRDFTGVFVPSTCCKLNEPRDPRRPQVTEENICQVEAIVHLETTQPITQLHTEGCHEALMTWIDSHEHFVVSLLCNVVLLQIVNVVFACLLINWIRKKHTDYSWCDIEDYQ